MQTNLICSSQLKHQVALEENDLASSVSTGPAQVPMMSPNGSVPPIYVPPGYVSQVFILYYFHTVLYIGILSGLWTALVSAFFSFS